MDRSGRLLSAVSACRVRRHFEPIQLFFDFVECIVADLVVGAHDHRYAISGPPTADTTPARRGRLIAVSGSKRQVEVWFGLASMRERATLVRGEKSTQSTKITEAVDRCALVFFVDLLGS
jgi:hypothetical protein